MLCHTCKSVPRSVTRELCTFASWVVFAPAPIGPRPSRLANHKRDQYRTTEEGVTHCEHLRRGIPEQDVVYPMHNKAARASRLARPSAQSIFQKRHRVRCPTPTTITMAARWNTPNRKRHTHRHRSARLKTINTRPRTTKSTNTSCRTRMASARSR